MTSPATEGAKSGWCLTMRFRLVIEALQTEESKDAKKQSIDLGHTRSQLSFRHGHFASRVFAQAGRSPNHATPTRPILGTPHVLAKPYLSAW